MTWQPQVREGSGCVSEVAGVRWPRRLAKLPRSFSFVPAVALTERPERRRLECQDPTLCTLLLITTTLRRTNRTTQLRRIPENVRPLGPSLAVDPV